MCQRAVLAKQYSQIPWEDSAVSQASAFIKIPHTALEAKIIQVYGMFTHRTSPLPKHFAGTASCNFEGAKC